MTDPSTPYYGLDAPAVVRNLFLAGGACLALALAGQLHLVPATVRWAPGAGFALQFSPLYLGLWAGLSLTLTGMLMVWSSRVGKLRRRDQLLNQLTWTGDEQVLDVGCGRGLLLIGAAKRLTAGRAIGVDIWRSEDLSGNAAEATLANARAEGVADRVQVDTADMRHLPYSDRSFDLVLSSAAIHNLDASADRDLAIQEIARVLKPGGVSLIDDIRHFAQYRDVFAANHCPLVRRLDQRMVSLFWTLLTWGSLRPGTLLVRKAT
jgi:arsenite methyltransferase